MAGVDLGEEGAMSGVERICVRFSGETICLLEGEWPQGPVGAQRKTGESADVSRDSSVVLSAGTTDAIPSAFADEGHVALQAASFSARCLGANEAEKVGGACFFCEPIIDLRSCHGDTYKVEGEWRPEILFQRPCLQTLYLEG